MSEGKSTKKVTGKARKRKISTSPTPKEQSWNLEEKQKFVTALCKGPPYRHENGSINWMQLKRFVGTRSLQEVKIFAKKFHAMEHGSTYPEFSTKAAIDVWRQLADKTKLDGDDIADVCIPQVLTVAALEPINSEAQSADSPSTSKTDEELEEPSYKNIYNYLSAITRGVEPSELTPIDAAVVLNLLEDLILTLSKSQTLIQREFLHSQYKELRTFLNHPDKEAPSSSSESSTKEDTEPKKKYSSTNPFGIPFEILNFKLLEQCVEKGQEKTQDVNKK